MKKSILLCLLFAFSMALFAQNSHKTVFSVEAGGTYYYSINNVANFNYSGDMLLSAYFTPKFKLSAGFSYAMEYFKYSSTTHYAIGSTKETVKLKVNYLQMPILASFTLKQKTNYSFSIFGGVIFKHLSRFHYNRVLESDVHPNTDYHADIKPHQHASRLSANFALGCTFSPRVGKQLRLNISPYIRFPYPKEADLLPTDYVLYDGGDKYLNKYDICLKISLEYTFKRDVTNSTKKP